MNASQIGHRLQYGRAGTCCVGNTHHYTYAVAEEMTTLGSTEALHGMIMWHQFMARLRSRTFRPIDPAPLIPFLLESERDMRTWILGSKPMPKLRLLLLVAAGWRTG